MASLELIMNIELTLIVVVVVVVVVAVACIFITQKKKKESYKRQATNCNARETCSLNNYEKMSHSREHRALINKPYNIQCKTEVFTLAELDIINEYGSWLSALASNQINPETKEQHVFVDGCQNFRTLDINEMFSYFSDRDDNGSIQSVWFKYLCRSKFERESPNTVSEKVKVDWGWQGSPMKSGDHVFFSK